MVLTIYNLLLSADCLTIGYKGDFHDFTLPTTEEIEKFFSEHPDIHNGYNITISYKDNKNLTGFEYRNGKFYLTLAEMSDVADPNFSVYTKILHKYFSDLTVVSRLSAPKLQLSSQMTVSHTHSFFTPFQVEFKDLGIIKTQCTNGRTSQHHRIRIPKFKIGEHTYRGSTIQIMVSGDVQGKVSFHTGDSAEINTLESIGILLGFTATVNKEIVSIE